MGERTAQLRLRLRMLLFSLYYGSSGERMGLMKKFLVLARVQLRSLLASLRVGGSRRKAASVCPPRGLCSAGGTGTCCCPCR